MTTSAESFDFKTMEQTIVANYKAATERYRRDDEIEVTSQNHVRLSKRLQEICLAFNRPINVLDAGCGTGRYFHCLRNVKTLVGIDVSEDMLAAASEPVRKDQVTVEKILLVRENIHYARFEPGQFDFIYSLGMFGYGCPVTTEICNRFHEWLAPGGRLFFDVIDVAGLPFPYRVRQKLRQLFYRSLPVSLRGRLEEKNAQIRQVGLSRRELKSIVGRSQFQSFELESHVCLSPLWQGRHLECLAMRHG